MNKKLLTIAATAALLAGTSGYAYAQGNSVDAGAGAGVDAGIAAGKDNSGVEADTGVNANASAQAKTNSNAGGVADQTLGHVIASLKTGFNADVSAVEEGTEVEIIAVSELKGEGGMNAEALDNALEAEADAVADLQADLEANTVILDELEAEGYEVADVVAVDTAADGHIVLYVQEAA